MVIKDFLPKVKPKDKLSKVPSKLLLQLADDLKWALRSKRIHFYMNCWVASKEGRCDVCAAGAMLLRRCPKKKSNKNYIIPYGIEYTAIDTLARDGSPFMFCQTLLPDKSIFPESKVRALRAFPTKEDIKRFIKEITVFSDELKGMGL